MKFDSRASVPVARAANLATPVLVVVTAGATGDGYGIGSNHFTYNAREGPEL